MRRVLLVAVALVVVLGGTAIVVGNVRADHKTAEQPVTLRIRLTQDRFDEVRRTVDIAMNNAGPSEVTVQRIELRAPSFQGTGPVRVDAPLPAGGLRVDVPVPYGTGICTGDELKPRSAPSHVALDVRTGDGHVHSVVLPLDDPDPMLDKLLAADCQQAYLDRRATFTFGPWTPAPHGRIHGTVVVRRVGFAGTVTLREFAGSVLLSVLPAPLLDHSPKPYGVLEPGQAELRIPIVVDGDRCTPHVLAEVKKTYVFPAFVLLDGGAPLYTELKVGEADKAAFKPVIDACAARHTPS